MLCLGIMTERAHDTLFHHADQGTKTIGNEKEYENFNKFKAL